MAAEKKTELQKAQDGVIAALEELFEVTNELIAKGSGKADDDEDTGKGKGTGRARRGAAKKDVPSVDACVAALKDVVALDGKRAGTKLLAEFNAESCSEIEEDDRAAFLERCNEITKAD